MLQIGVVLNLPQHSSNSFVKKKNHSSNREPSSASSGETNRPTVSTSRLCQENRRGEDYTVKGDYLV